MSPDIKPLKREDYISLIHLAKEEDLGCGDVTSEATIPEDQKGQAQICFRQPGIICGLPVAQAILTEYHPQLTLESNCTDGQSIDAGQNTGTISGPLRHMLSAERVVLNFLQHLSGIATQTEKYVEQTKGSKTQICDTRKTIPGWRQLEKYAVRCGGGTNHRMGLYDAGLIKDNHIAALNKETWSEGLAEAVNRLYDNHPDLKFIEAEVDNLDQLSQILNFKHIHIILLDNMNNEQIAKAVAMRNEMNPNILLEASGGITLNRIKEISAIGVDRISIGALTHHIESLDIGLDLIE